MSKYLTIDNKNGMLYGMIVLCSQPSENKCHLGVFKISSLLVCGLLAYGCTYTLSNTLQGKQFAALGLAELTIVRNNMFVKYVC